MLLEVITQNGTQSLILSAFPLKPVPSTATKQSPPFGEIDSWLDHSFSRKTWEIVDCIEIADANYAIAALQGCFSPEAYAYYLPSIMIGSNSSALLLDYSLRWLLPANKSFERRRGWWSDMESSLNSKQRQAIRAFFLSANSFAQIGTQESYLVEAGLSIWV
jgi:hypothetical protein